jgi:hypothetical protein
VRSSGCPGAIERPQRLLTYWSLLDQHTGRDQLSDHWLLAYTDIQPTEGFDKRYRVFRSIEVSLSHRGPGPQVGILLARWRNARLHDQWSTTAARFPAMDSPINSTASSVIS